MDGGKLKAVILNKNTVAEFFLQLENEELTLKIIYYMNENLTKEQKVKSVKVPNGLSDDQFERAMKLLDDAEKIKKSASYAKKKASKYYKPEETKVGKTEKKTDKQGSEGTGDTLSGVRGDKG